MNITLSHLFLIDIYKNSPYFSSLKGYSSSNSYFQIEKSSFIHFFNSLYYSSFSKPGKKFIATSTIFQKFLSSALFFDHNYIYSNETLDSRRLSFIIGPVNISYCIFRLCLGSTKNIFGSDTFHSKGGAIFCLTNLSIFQCLFEHNSAAKGGSIYCSGQLTMKSVTFEGGFSEDSQGFANENCDSMPLSLELCLFFNLQSIKHTCFSRVSPGLVSVNSDNISTNTASQENAGFYLSEATSLIMKYSILFELISLTETSVYMTNCGKSEFNKILFWYIKSNTNLKSGSTCVSYYDTNSICSVQDSSFLICSPGNSKLFAVRGGAQILISGACSTDSQDEFYYEKLKKSDSNNFNENNISDYNIIFDKWSRFNDQCADRYVIYVSEPFGYYIKNEETELALKKTDIYDGFIIGALGLIIVTISSIVSFSLFYQCS